MTLRHRLERHSMVGPGQSAEACWDFLARRFQGTISGCSAVQQILQETQGETGLPTSPRARKGQEIRQAGVLDGVGPMQCRG